MSGTLRGNVKRPVGVARHIIADIGDVQEHLAFR